MKKQKEASKKTKKNPEGTIVSKTFEFALTQEESDNLGKKAASISMNILATELNFKEVKADWNAKIKTMKAERDTLSKAITDGKEERTVDAVLVKDYTAKEIKFYFDGAVIEARTMTTEESQMELEEHLKKQSRGKKQKLQLVKNTNGNEAESEIGDVIKEETSRRTKRSAVDPVPAF
jgi:hypothetical protein